MDGEDDEEGCWFTKSVFLGTDLVAFCKDLLIF